MSSGEVIWAMTNRGSFIAQDALAQSNSVGTSFEALFVHPWQKNNSMTDAQINKWNIMISWDRSW